MLNLACVFVTLLVAGVPAPPLQSPAQASVPAPVTAHLMTVVDHVGVLGGQTLAVPVARVVYIVGPRLIVVGEPRTFGVDPEYWHDRLLVLLPAPVQLVRGQLIAVTGTLRTVAGARAAGAPIDRAIDEARNAKGGKRAKEKDSSRMARWLVNAPVIVADSTATVDGAILR